MIPTDDMSLTTGAGSELGSDRARLQPGSPFFSLRTKFVLFFSLILILTCSTLSWYLVEKRRAAMIENLQQVGSILLASVVGNEHFRYGGLVAEDRAVLKTFVEGLMAVQDVVYVVVTSSDGTALMRNTKGAHQSSSGLDRSPQFPIYPDAEIARRLLQSPVSTPEITLLSFVNKVSNRFAWEEHVYDFALPVMRSSQANTPLVPFSLEMEEHSSNPRPAQPLRVSGVVQIGLSDARLRQELLSMITNVLFLTIAIISAGILGANLLTVRITTPLRSLAVRAKQLAAGESPQPLTPSTRDEVGQLTSLFNEMTQALQERNRAITTNLETIRRQISQLTTLHQASAAIASNLDMTQLMDTVFQLLLGNLGYVRMVLILRKAETETAFVAHIAGVPPEIAEAARRISIPIRNNGTINADLLIHGKPVLIPDIEAASQRFHPPVLELARRAGVHSMVAVPLQSHSQNLGYLAGDRGEQRCTEEDLDVLTTIGSHVAAAIDNVQAYSSLADLTRTLEERIKERTEELSLANERLKEQDRRRAMFLSVASHELRTPMTAIRSFAENMLDGVTGSLNPQQVTYLGRVEHNVARLARIINQLLDWSRLDSKKDSLDLQPTCLRAITMSVIGSLQTLAAEKRIALTMQPADNLPMVLADPDKLEQILWNLIGNALKFTPADGRVTVSFEADPKGFVRTCVADTGCGIAPENMPNIFNEFSKIQSAVPSAQGAQLGLFITKTLIAMHHGEIRVESTPNVGTRMIFTIPTVGNHAHAAK